ncbi:MAG: DUF362 domain-containing protein [Thermodesulfobacteriota bacterium]|nr:DUF362 domain-containing protein [Thermodesulfobacteriota bacterium]
MISILKYQDHDTIQQAIDLCGGFEKLGATDKIVIKPNAVGSDRNMPYYGMMTTATVVEGVVRALITHGCRPENIIIGDGGAASRELGFNTRIVLTAMGMRHIARTYGVRMIDFNAAPMETVECGKLKLEIARPVMEADFLINVPVPKYHDQTGVSLSLKNLKGCLALAAKRRCHTARLEEHIAAFNTKIPCHLTVMDGIYFLRGGGPLIDSGEPCRKNMIMAGTDRIEVDSAAAWILGVDAKTVRHLTAYARMMDREGDVGRVDWAGEDPAAFREPPFDREVEVFSRNFQRSGVKGIRIQPAGQTWCTGCNISLRAALSLLCKDNPGHDFGDVEIVCGKQAKASGDHERTILFGDCPLKTHVRNTAIRDRLEISGCPPSFLKAYPAMMRFLLPSMRAGWQVTKNLTLGGLTHTGLYRMRFPFFDEITRSDQFDPMDFYRK